MSRKNGDKNSHFRHLAFQIVAQLPEETADAVAVLEYARRLLLAPVDEPGAVVPFKVVDTGG